MEEEYLKQYNMSRQELWLLVGLLMERIIRNINGRYYYEVPQKQNLAPSATIIEDSTISKLVQANYLKTIPNSAFLHLSDAGCEKAMTILDIVHGTVYNPPKEIKDAVVATYI